jgi:cytochrome o ubiquinol oxidase subunit II
MHFDVHVVPSGRFSQWAQDASTAAKALDERSYPELAKPSMNNVPAIYRLADPDIFNAIVTQKLPPAPGAPAGVIGTSLRTGDADAR